MERRSTALANIVMHARASRFKRRGLERGAGGIRVPTICSWHRQTLVVRCSLFLVHGAGVTVLNVRLMHLRSPQLASGTP